MLLPISLANGGQFVDRTSHELPFVALIRLKENELFSTLFIIHLLLRNNSFHYANMLLHRPLFVKDFLSRLSNDFLESLMDSGQSRQGEATIQPPTFATPFD